MALDPGADRRHPDDRGGGRVRRGVRRSRAHRHLARDHGAAVRRRDRRRASRRWCGCPSHDHQYLTRSLDVGAMGVIVPHVETRAEAERDRRRVPLPAARPPVGRRARTRRTATGRCRSSELLDAFDAQTMVAVMLETPAAVAAADEIASVPGLDMVMIGPHDLTAEMGILGQFRDEAFLDAVRTVAKACRAHGTIFGIAGIRDLELLTEFVELGLRFVSAGTDAGFMTEAAARTPPACARFRSAYGGDEERAHEHRRSTPSRCTTRWRGSAPTSRATRSSSTGSTPAHGAAGSRRSSSASATCRATTSTREHVGHPDVDGPAREVYEELISGPRARGRARVPGGRAHDRGERSGSTGRGCRTSVELLSNNSFGHRMVRVQQEVLPGGVQPARGTKSAAELAMHNDSADLFSLLWVHQAERGGESQFSSGPAAHNTILATRPDILPILYRGFPHHRRSEQPDDQPDVTPYDVPIFSNVDGRICINFTYSSILPALHELGRELTPEEDEALEILRGVLVQPAGRAAHAAGRRGDGEQLRHVPLALRLRRRQRPGAPATGPAGVERGADRGSSTADRARVLPHGERGWAPRVRPGARAGRAASRSTTTATSTRTSPTCSRRRRSSPSSTDRATPRRLVYFDQWTDPVAGERARRPRRRRRDAPGDHRRRRRELGRARTCARVPVAHPHRARPQPRRRRAVDLPGRRCSSAAPTCSPSARRARATTSSTSRRAPPPA